MEEIAVEPWGMKTLVYAVINNIPNIYRSADLRKFFSSFIETGGFHCFHFRHRPELQSVKKSVQQGSGQIDKSTLLTDIKTFCCIVRLTEQKFIEFSRTYHQRNWQDNKRNSVASKCLISRLKISPPVDGSSSSRESSIQQQSSAVAKYQTRGDRQRIPQNREEFKEDDLLKLPELRPPSLMPNGNVGTPTLFFMKLIQECRLPPSIIKKLQLDFPKSRGKGKYGSVPFDYQTKTSVKRGDGTLSTAHSAPRTLKKSKAANGTHNSQIIPETVTVSDSDSSPQDDLVSSSADRETLALAVVVSDTENEAQAGSCSFRTSEPTGVRQTETSQTDSGREPAVDFIFRERRRLRKLEKQERRKLMAERIEEKMIEFEKAGSGSEDDNDTCEEWERHEAMYDDVTNQGRNNDRLFEEEMEVVWEKGGSGLVFYTDAQYWEEKEGDFDEQTADDLDVDMSAYYEQGAGDPDIRDFLTIRREQRRRRGVEKTDRYSAGIGKFERHTKGFGRKIMEKQGWVEGTGLGSSVKGISDALDTEGQHPRNRTGLGYRGEKLVKNAYISAAKKRRAEGDVIISTIYDNPSETDPVETLHRRNDPSYIKHRNRIN